MRCIVLPLLFILNTHFASAKDAKDEALDTLEKQGVKEIVFCERTVQANAHWYANFGHYTDNVPDYGDCGRLAKLNVKTGKDTVLLEDLRGAVRDPIVHYDAQKILFSYRKGGEEHYHLYEIDVGGSGLRQLTDGDYDDVEPTYLPNGDIVFVSSRARRWVNCFPSEVGTVHRCDANGGHIRMLSCNIEQDNTPWVLHDGRVAYMRWEYVDRCQVTFHHLWTMNPDGTGQMVLFGNMHQGGVFIDAKPVPGSDKLCFIDSPGHGREEHAGTLALLSTRNGPDDLKSKQHLGGGDDSRDPWPFSEQHILFAVGDEIRMMTGPNRWATLYKSARVRPANLQTLGVHPGIMVHEPRPLVKRVREPIIADRGDASKPEGTFVLQNAYMGRNMKGVKPGDISKLLVVELLPKPINYGGGGFDHLPMSWFGTYTLERILGTVPVEKDGSACFTVPANRPVFFIALDARGRSVKRMQSFTSVMPGELFSCLGCHEERVNAAAAQRGALLALKRPPSKPDPIAGFAGPFDFPRDIQPILDRHCLKCHDFDTPNAGLVLSADDGPVFNHAYFSLAARHVISDGRNGPGNTAPRMIGDSASRLMSLVEGSHHDVKLSAAEITTLRNWHHCGCNFAGTYASVGSSLVRLSTYDFPQGNTIAAKRIEALPPGVVAKARDAVTRRCSSCHGGFAMLGDPQGYYHQGDAPMGRPLYNQHHLYNLTRPEKSPILLAPLAKSAGGSGNMIRTLPGGTNQVCEAFATAQDPDYQAILAMIQAGHEILERSPRYYRAGFKPTPDYLREMKRYGILKADFDPARDACDVFEIDRKYWESFWRSPESR